MQQSEPGKVRLKTYRDVVLQYRTHPERRSRDPRGGAGVAGTKGLLPRQPVVATSVHHIGKESNRLEEVEIGFLRQFDEVYVEYRDPRGEWEAALPALTAIGTKKLAELTGMSERTLRSRLNSGRLPRSDARRKLLVIAVAAIADHSA